MEVNFPKRRLTGIHGEPQTGLRRHVQNLLINLSKANQLSYLCVGNFNEVLNVEEKIGGWGGEDFRNTIQAIRLYDLGYQG